MCDIHNSTLTKYLRLKVKELRRRVPTGMHGLGLNMNKDARGVLLKEVLHRPFDGTVAVAATIDSDGDGASSDCMR